MGQRAADVPVVAPPPAQGDHARQETTVLEIRGKWIDVLGHFGGVVPLAGGGNARPVREPCSASRDDARRGRAVLNRCTASGSIAVADELPPWFDLVRAGGKRLPRPCSRLASSDDARSWRFPPRPRGCCGAGPPAIAAPDYSAETGLDLLRPFEHRPYAKPAAMRRACRAASFSA
jgi:hypothetical protein